MRWLVIILVVALIGGIIGMLVSDNKAEGFAAGALEFGGGCAGIIWKIFVWGIAIVLIIKLFGWLFG